MFYPFKGVVCLLLLDEVNDKADKPRFSPRVVESPS